MAPDPERLFPAAETREMLAIIGNSGGGIGVLRGPVEQGTIRVREMLGEYAGLAAAAASWNEQILAHLRSAQRLIEAAGPALAANWSGDAYHAYRGYEATVLGRAGDTVRQAQGVADVVAGVRATVAGQYRAATTALATIIAGVIGLAGGRGYLPWRAAGEFARLAYTFVGEVEESIDRVNDTLDAGRDRVARVSEAAAAHLLPGPRQVAGPVIGEPGSWRQLPGGRSTD